VYVGLDFNSILQGNLDVPVTGASETEVHQDEESNEDGRRDVGSSFEPHLFVFQVGFLSVSRNEHHHDRFKSY
jgi:hypothetical protein